MPKTTDALLKSLYDFLFVDIPAEDLRRLGWFEFQKFDHPKSTDPVEIGAEALRVLFCTKDKSYDRLCGARRVITFVCGETGKPMPGSASIRTLSEILAEGLPEQAAIHDWFEATFR